MGEFDAGMFWRRFKELSEKDLPVILKTSIKQSTISMWRQRKKFPRADEALAMKTINLSLTSYEIKGCFEEYLSDAYKTFPHMLRVIEEQMPTLIRPYAGNGQIPYQYTPFIRSFLAKGYFGQGQRTMYANSLCCKELRFQL
jgi:hypothetical protein